MRYVIYGAGAVGGAIGGRLAEHGHEVVLVARGAHGEALRSRGLELQTPDGVGVHKTEVVTAPAELDFHDDDVVVLAMKTQDTAAAVAALSLAAPPTTPVVCAQNSVENERIALRAFHNVYAMCVMLPATHLEPGVVQVNAAPLSGILDLGRYPSGVDGVTEQVAADLDASGFSSRPDPAIMRSKYTKLLMNLGNAIEAACGSAARGSDLYARARAEAVACFDAAGIAYASAEEDAARRGELFRIRPVNGQRRGGGSSWQSLARGAGSIESDYLNGEIVLLGRLHGVPTPVNAAVQRVANRMAASGAAPGSMTVDDLAAEVDAS